MSPERARRELVTGYQGVQTPACVKGIANGLNRPPAIFGSCLQRSRLRATP